MDPLSLAVQKFHEALRVRLEPAAPGEAAPAAICRLVVEDVTPSEVLKALRLYEYRDENRYPFIVFADDFEDEASFLRLAIAQLEGDEASVREGLAEEGRVIERTDFGANEVSVLGLAAGVAKFAKEVASQLAGVVVVLSPPRVQDASAYERFAQALSARAELPELAVFVRDHGGEMLRKIAPEQVELRVDRRALLKHVRNLKSPNDVGPRREGVPQLTTEQRRDLERKLGRRTLSKGTGQALKELLFDAGEAHSEGKHELATKKFRMARTLCHLRGLRQEEVTCAIAVGTGHFTCGRYDRARQAFEEARSLGVELEASRVVMQAELGIATTYLAQSEYMKARQAYRKVYDAAAGLPPMQVESLRMQGECFVQERRAADAIEIWMLALDEVEALDPPQRGGTAFKFIGKRLVEELTSLGKVHHAPAVQRRIAEIEEASIGANVQGSKRSSADEVTA